MPILTKQITTSLKIEVNQQFKQSLSASLGDTTIQDMTDQELKEFLNPKPEDYIRIPMRALSATAVQGDTINFGHNGGKALRDAVPLFDGLIILKDHDQTVDKWLGRTENPYWDDSIPNTPPGVNFMLVVDSKADPKVARGLLSGMLESGSVTIQFDYDQSHPEMKVFDFLMALGSTVKGKTVQALVTSVTRCFEYSIVWQGADTTAKAIRPDGSISKAGLDQSTEETSMKKLAALVNLADTATEDEVATAIAVALASLTAAETAKTAADQQFTQLQATVTQKETELAAKLTEIAALTINVTALTNEKSVLTAEITALKAGQEAFSAHLTSRRAEALRLYKLSEGDKALAPMEAAIGSANLDTTESFISTFGTKAETLFPMECTKCHSTELSRRKSAQSETRPEKSDDNHTKALKQSISFIHG